MFRTVRSEFVGQIKKIVCTLYFIDTNHFPGSYKQLTLEDWNAEVIGKIDSHRISN